MKRFVLMTLLLTAWVAPTIADNATPSDGIPQDELVERPGLHYKKFSTTLFTGTTKHELSVKVKNGSKVTAYKTCVDGLSHSLEISWCDNGQLYDIGRKRRGEMFGRFEHYFECDGVLREVT